MEKRRIAWWLLVAMLVAGCATDDGSDGGSGAGSPITVAEEDWLEGDGQETDLVTSFYGDAHCDLDTTEIIRVSAELVPPREEGWPATTFAHDPEDGLPDRVTAAEYDGDATLPDDAEPTGVRTDSGIELWSAPDDPDVIYLVDAGTVERWPAASVECD